MELLTVVAIIGILAAVAVPSFFKLRQGIEYRQAARDVASALRDARSKAITTNRQHRVVLTAPRSFQIAQGDRAHNSAGWTLLSVAKSIPLTSQLTTTNVEFNPNGTAETAVTIPIQDSSTLAVRFNIDVTTIGKIAIKTP